jgi:UPF0716 family protein affecting phage T7 exclusion
MNIGLIIFAIIGSIIGLASTFYIVISMFWILGVKIVRRKLWKNEIYYKA